MSILSGFISNTLSLKCSSFPPQNPCCSYIIPYKISQLSVNSKSTPAAAAAIFNLKNKPISRRFLISPPPSAAAETLSADTTIEASDSASPKPTDFPQDVTQEVKEVVMVKALGKQIQKPRLVLKFIWMEKNIGLGLDQLIPGHGTVPLSPYFFWPRKDAWEELKAVLESKPSISQKKMIILLNQATDIINLWQQSGGNLSS